MAAANTTPPPGPPGPAVDAQQRVADDPTENVMQLVEAAVKRLDDLREMESRCNHEVADLRTYYDEKLREAESKRIDAIRAVDVGAVQRTAEVSATQAQTLAVQVAQSAEALRAQVAATAAAADSKLAAALDPIQKDIADLRKAQYEAQGTRAQVVETRAQVTEGRGGQGLMIAAIGLGITLFFAVIGLIGVIAAGGSP